MASRFLSTGGAAKICSVTPDTILKWIRSGLLPARRTAGGHHRIDPRDLERVLNAASKHTDDRHFQYCWEFKGNGGILQGCRDCVVYSLRAQRCYDAVRIAGGNGHQRLFCSESCEECDYYGQVHGQNTNVLVVSDDASLVSSLQADAEEAPFNLQFTDCEYTTSALVDSFRPDYVVVDCQLGRARSTDICKHLVEDPRIPFVRLILAGEEDQFPADCEVSRVYAKIEKPFDLEALAQCTSGAQAPG